MRHHLPRRYTILISCTGKAPIVLSLRPLAILFSLALPIALLAGIIYSFADRNAQLAKRNSNLTEEASNILEKIEALESKIKALQDRAGTSQDDSVPADKQGFAPQGGGGMAVIEAEMLLALARAQLPILEDRQTEVEPALKQTLAREEAKPKGMPLLVKAETSSTFGFRSDPFGWGYEFHQGIDFAADYGTPVYATAAGKVEDAGWDAGFGYHVVVSHPDGYRTLYAHLSAIKVSQGIKIDRHQVVGYLGSTGRSNGPHLHYGIYHHSFAVDPKGYLD